MANSCGIPLGIGFAFPTITYDCLIDETNPTAITKDQASWYGKYTHKHYILAMQHLALHLTLSTNCFSINEQHLHADRLHHQQLHTRFVWPKKSFVYNQLDFNIVMGHNGHSQFNR